MMPSFMYWKLLYALLIVGIDSKIIQFEDFNKNVLSASNGDLVPREDILNHALASSEMALEHVKENWIPLFDENAVLDDPTGSHEFKGILMTLN